MPAANDAVPRSSAAVVADSTLERAAICDALDPSGWTLAQVRTDRLAAAEGDRCHAGGWDDAEIARFQARVRRFHAFGIRVDDAQDLAEHLVLRDRVDDDRHQCPECAHLDGHKATGWRCRNHRRAQVARELPHDLVLLPQRCPGFNA